MYRVPETTKYPKLPEPGIPHIMRIEPITAGQAFITIDMARHRPEVGNKVKKRLVHEAGDKCANPGCPNRRTHAHHIREWAIYQTHDEEHMIAVCPSCHDAIHHGDLPIDDETIYGWKGISRTDETVRGHLYVEPGTSTRLLLGTFAVAAPEEVVVFDLAPTNRLTFRVKSQDIMLLDLRMTSLSGGEVVSVTDNHVRHSPVPPTEYRQVPGHIQVQVPASSEFIQPWALQKMRTHEPGYAGNGMITALSLEVLEPGLIRVEGLWAQSNRVIVITRRQLTFISAQSGPVSLAGQGVNSVLVWQGPITDAMFRFV